MLSLLLSFSILYSAKSQSLRPYKAFDLGLATGLNMLSGDAEKSNITTSFHINGAYNFHRYMSLSIELQKGKLTGGDINSKSGREFANKYSAVVFKGQICAGAIIGYSQNTLTDFFKNAYLGSGIGVINNDLISISRYTYEDYNYYTPGPDISRSAFVPVRLGYEIRLVNRYEENFLKIDIAFQRNYSLNDYVDGFDAGKRNDTFDTFSIGVKLGVFGNNWGNN